jgi:hypothetical protein
MYQLPPLPVKKKPKAPYRKPDAVKALEAMAYANDAAMHPSIKPEHLAPRRYRDDTANGLTQCVVAFAKLQGCFASRLNSTGVYDAKLKKYRFTTQRRGLPDVLITGRDGQSIFCELKVGKDKMSLHQERIRDEQRQAGGIYMTINSFTQFYEWWSEKYEVPTEPPKNCQLTDNQYMRSAAVQ